MCDITLPYQQSCWRTWCRCSSSFLVTCPAGMYHNDSEGRCADCELGSYQFKTGQTQCITCPPQTKTVATRAKTLEQCKGKNRAKRRLRCFLRRNKSMSRWWKHRHVGIISKMRVPPRNLTIGRSPFYFISSDMIFYPGLVFPHSRKFPYFREIWWIWILFSTFFPVIITSHYVKEI